MDENEDRLCDPFVDLYHPALDVESDWHEMTGFLGDVAACHWRRDEADQGADW